MKQYILFDLDGTLTDAGPGITNSVAYALAQFGISEPDRRKLNPFVGPPLKDSFARYYHFSPEEVSRAIDHYRVYFEEKGIFENALYDGIVPLLAACKEAGKTLVLATSKPRVFAERILTHFQIASFFDFVAGSELDEKTRVNKEEVIEYALESMKIPPSEAVMIGDTKFDILGGKRFSLLTVGVLYGYGSAEELSEAGADHVVGTVEELQELLFDLLGNDPRRNKR